MPGSLNLNLILAGMQVSGVSAAAGLKSGQSNRKRDSVISNKGALSRSDLILFVLVLVLVLVLGDQNFIEDEGRGRRRGRLEHL